MDSQLSQVGGMVAMLRDRAVGALQPRDARQLLHFPEVFAQHLDVQAVLQGHMGCVNRLAWNQEGTMLASCSDDRSVALWHYPDSDRPPIHFLTQHQSNIFGVAFLPFRNSSHIITGAMDGLVQLHVLDSEAASRQVRTSVRHVHRRGSDCFTAVQTHDYFCHKNRIKAVDVDPTDANLFWSGSEDGTVQQFDVRCPPQTWASDSNLLIQLRQHTQPLDVLSLRINKARPWQMGVAAADQYVRIFDRRKLDPGRQQDPDLSTKEVLKVAPPHLCMQPAKNGHRANPTHVDFGRRGDKIVATYHAEHAYSFRIDGAAVDAQARAFQPPPLREQSELESRAGQPFATCPGRLPTVRPMKLLFERTSSQDLPPGADAAKREGNQAFFDSDDNAAVWHYTKAIHLAPSCAVLYIMRAAAYLKRDWMGDNFAALADCEAAILIDPTLIKAYCRRIVALISLGQLQAAERALEAFKEYFPKSVEDQERLQATLIREITAQQARVEQSENLQHTLYNSRLADRRAAQDIDTAVEAGDGREAGDVSMEPEGFTFEAGFLDTWQRTVRPTSEAEKIESMLDEEYRFPWRMAAETHSMQQRYVGHRNVQTDIKEAVFMGGFDNLVAAGSDDGQVFIYNSDTGYPVRCLQADEDVVNCVQPHPSLPVLATSGIEHVVRLWGCKAAPDTSRLQNIMHTIRVNQQKLKHHSCLYARAPNRIVQALAQNQQLAHILLTYDPYASIAADNAAQGPNPQDSNCRLA